MDTAEDFMTLVEKLVHLILVHHKHSRLPKTLNDPIPGFLAEAEAYLIRKIQPFLPSEETSLCAHNNAKNWTAATLETLNEHYDRIKNNTIDRIRALLVPDWNRAFLVASRRARQHSKNINPNSFESTYMVLRDIMSPSFPLLENPPISFSKMSNQDLREKKAKILDPQEKLPPPKQPTILQSVKLGGPTTLIGNDELLVPLTLVEQTKNKTNIEQTQKNKRPSLTPKSSTSVTGPWVRITPLSPLTEITNGTLRRQTHTTTPRNTSGPLAKENTECGTEHPVIKKRKTNTTEETSSGTPQEHSTPLDSPYLPESTQQTHGAIYHTHQGNGFENWTLEPRRPIIIIGDSNIEKLPHTEDDRIQTDCYPGAKITHAVHIIKHKTPREPLVTTVILSFGISDRETSNPSWLEKPLGSLFNAAKVKFPNALIYMPLINFSKNLPPQIQRNITQLNLMIKSRNAFIPRLDKDNFKTLPDNIHWTPDTAYNMLTHWLNFLE